MFSLLQLFLVGFILLRCHKYDEVNEKMGIDRFIIILAALFVPMFIFSQAVVNNVWFVAIFGVLTLSAILLLKEVGTSLIVLGGYSNFLVKTLNNGQMPVSTEAARQLGINCFSAGHAAITTQTRLPFLADIFPVELMGVMSLGDIIIFTGLLLLYVRCMKIKPSFNDLLLA
jgi:hypothetical protein